MNEHSEQSWSTTDAEDGPNEPQTTRKQSEYVKLPQHPRHSEAPPKTSSEQQSDTDVLLSEVRSSLQQKQLSGELGEASLELEFESCNCNRTTESEQTRASIAYRLEAEAGQNERDRKFRRVQEQQARQYSPFRGRSMVRCGRQKVVQQLQLIDNASTVDTAPSNVTYGSTGSSSDLSRWPSIS